MATSIFRLDAINYLRKHPDDTVFAAMFHDIRIDIFNEDPIANPLAYTFSCTRRDWLTYGPLLVTQHPINFINLTDLVCIYAPILTEYVYQIYIPSQPTAFEVNAPSCSLPSVFVSWLDYGEWYSFDHLEEAQNFVSDKSLAWALKHLPKSKSKGRGGKKKEVPLPPLYITPDNKGSFLHVPPS